MLKDIPSNELINLTVKQLSEKYFYQDCSIRNEIRKRGLKNIYVNRSVEVNISLEDYKNHSIRELSNRNKVSRHNVVLYALKTYNLTMEDLKRFGVERIEKRYDLSHISDEELSKPFTYLTKTYGVPPRSIRTEREKRGIIILARSPHAIKLKKASDDEIFNTSIKDLIGKYGVSGDTICRERRRRKKDNNTLKTNISVKRKLEDVSNEELFNSRVSQLQQKYNVGENTVTRERKRRNKWV